MLKRHIRIFFDENYDKLSLLRKNWLRSFKTVIKKAVESNTFYESFINGFSAFQL